MFWIPDKCFALSGMTVFGCGWILDTVRYKRKLAVCQKQTVSGKRIGWLKVTFAIAVALDASLVAWLAQNYATAKLVILVAAVLAAVVIAFTAMLINRRAFRRMEELEDN